MIFAKSDDVRVVAEDLIGRYHQHLLGVRVEYLFSSKTPKSKGSEVWGSARKISGLSAFLAGDHSENPNDSFFVIVISRPIWDQIDEAKRRALVDHELCHCWVNEEGDLTTIGHDLEEFGAIVHRHGQWREDITRFLSAAGQLALFGDSEG